MDDDKQLRGQLAHMTIQLPTTRKGVREIMSKYYWATPEEIERTRKRNRTLLMIAVPVVTVILSAVVTLILH